MNVHVLRGWALAAAFGVVSIAACGGEDGPGASGGDLDGGGGSSGGGSSGAGSSSGGSTELTPVPREKFAEEMAKAMCEGLEACCRNDGLGYDPNACAESMKNGELEKLEQQLSSPDLVYDPLGGAACIEVARLVNQLCAAPSSSVPDFSATSDEVYARTMQMYALCPRFATGPKQPGEACAYGTCAVPDNAFATYCATPTDRPEVTQTECWLVLSGREGDPCDTEPVTPIWRMCTLDTSPTTAPRSEKEALERALVCDETSKRCVRAASLAAMPGESCAEKRCFRGACDAGICVERAVGESCETNGECVRGANCRDRRCVAGLPDGTACTQDGPKCLGKCNAAGRCAPEATGTANKQRCEGAEQ